MLFSLLLLIQFVYVMAKTHNFPVFQQSDQNKVEHVWHSYIFNTGAGNREELHFSSVGFDSHFNISKNVFMWKSIHIEEKVAVVGACNNSLLITVYNKEIESVTHLIELEGFPVSLALFQKWDVKNQEVRNFAVVAVQVTDTNSVIQWYEILNGSLKLIWDWPFHKRIIHVDIIKIGHESKLLVVSHNDKIYKSSSADIYSFSVVEIVDVWLFEKINLDTIPSSVTVFDTIDYVFLSASFPSLEMVHIFRYSKSMCFEKSEQKHFVSHQKIYGIGLKSVTSFQVGFRWYLAVASKSSSIYHLTENFSFQPLNALHLNNINFWLAVPFDSYREDVMLLADSGSDVSLITWTGDENFEIIGSFTKLTCGNDTNCLERIKSVSLKDSTAFSFNGYQNILMARENEAPLMFKFLIKLTPVPDEVMINLNDILKTKNLLEENFNHQNIQINHLRSHKEEYSGGVKSVVLIAPTNEESGNLEAEAQMKNWTEIMSDINNLKTKIESLAADIRKFQRDLKSNVSYQNEPKSMSVLPRNVPEGITFYGNILINDLYLSTINGHNVSEIFKNSYRKNKVGKIYGKKTLRKLNAENVMFEKLGEILACDVIFSDDLCEEENRNVINGNVIVENNLNILNDIVLTKPKTAYDPLQKRSTLVYDALEFDALEVAEETYIQGTINGELFILPVHDVHLDILSTVNQARIEIVNVEHNVEVGLINGKNFSRIFEQAILKKLAQSRNETIKLNGAFRAPALEVHEINAIDFKEEILKQENQESEKFVHRPVEYKLGKLKAAQKLNLKRTVHVFQNLEINGTLSSDRVNNVTWEVLKNTVKKDENNVSVGGLKTFQKVLKATEITSRGTVNGRFVEHVMNNFSDQMLWFPQIFDSVKFKNLSLKGSWNGIHVNRLDKSLYRLSYANDCNCTVVFEDECVASELDVTRSINDFSLNNQKINKLSGDKFEVKTIKTPTVILLGSLVTNNKINQINLTNFDLLRVSLKSPQTIEHDLSHHNITVGGDLNLKMLNLNDVTDVANPGGDTSLIEKFLSGDIHRIKKLLVKGLVRTSFGINGFNLSNVFEKGIYIAKPNAVNGNITFENIVNFNDINVTNSIDGISLKRLEKDIVLKHGQVFLNGGKNFSTVKVTRNMKARTLNGHLVQEIVSLKGDHNMKGLVYVNGDVVVKGDVTTYSSINNISVPDLLRTFSTTFNSYIHSGDLNLENEKITVRNLVLDGDIQNVSLEAIINDGIKKQENFSALGTKSFNGKVTFRKNILVENLIHELNFPDFYADLVLINEPSKLEGTIKIEEAVLKLLEVKGYFNSTLINKIDTDEWFEESISLDKYETVNGKKTFKSVLVSRDVSANFINNHLPSAMIYLKQKQHIPVMVLFPKIHAMTDLSVSGSVNGRNLIKEFQDSVMSYGDQTIDGHILFGDEFEINGNLYVDTIKKRKINDLITLDTDQKVRTPLKFKGLVTAKGNIENLKTINEVDVADWNRKSVALNQEQVLSGFWTVKGIVKTRNINGDGLMHGMSLTDFSKHVHDGKLMALKIKNETETEYTRQCWKINKLAEEFSQLPYLFHQFEIAQEIETVSVIESAITLKINKEEYLIVSFVNNCFSSLYKWDTESTLYNHVRELNIGPVSKWIVAYLNEVTYVVTTSLKSGVTCEENLQQSNVWIFEKNHNKYAHLSFKTRFVDIIQENSSSAEFYSLDENGDINRWILGEGPNVTSKFLFNVGQSTNYKFIDFRITKGLAVSNGREIRQYKQNGDQMTQSTLLLFNAQMMALPIDGKILTAVILKDKVVVYENLLDDKVFSVIHIYKAGSAVWLNYGPTKQAFLIIASHHKFIEVFEYRGVSGFVKVISFSMFSSKLQSVILPSKKPFQTDKFLTVIQKKKLIFLRADMFGDFLQMECSSC